MLFDTVKLQNITEVTPDEERKKLYDEIKIHLVLKAKLNLIYKYIDYKLEEYFSHYEEQGNTNIHLKAVYIFGSDWTGTPIQEIYDYFNSIYSSNEAFEFSKQIIGCFLKETVINAKENYMCQYFPEKGYVYSR